VVGVVDQAQELLAAEFVGDALNVLPADAKTAAITTIETSIAAGGSVYHLAGGSVAQSFEPIAKTAVAVPSWDETALIAAIRADQAGRSTFTEFLRAAWNAGVTGFRVDLTERTRTYVGAGTNTYVETYPAVTLTD
jgi:uncharacterized protein YbcV (DUF1398 family)